MEAELEEISNFLDGLDGSLGAKAASKPLPPPPPPPTPDSGHSPRRSSLFDGAVDDKMTVPPMPTSPEEIISRLMHELTVRDAKIQELCSENEELRNELVIRESFDTPPKSKSQGGGRSISSAGFSALKVKEKLTRFDAAGALFSDLLSDPPSPEGDKSFAEVDPLLALGMVKGASRVVPDMSEILNANHLMTEQQREEAEARRDRDRQEARSAKADGMEDQDDDGSIFHSNRSSGESEERLFKDSDTPPPKSSAGVENEMPYQEFVHRLMKPECDVLVGVIRRFLNSILGPNGDGTKPAAGWKGDYLFYGTEHLSKRCTDFWEGMKEHFCAHPSWRKESEERINSAVDCLERYVMTRIAELAFRDTSEPVEDETLARRMQLLQFLKPEHLEIRPDMHNELIWALARDELRRINSFKTPGEKIECVVRCASVIFRALTVAQMKAKDNNPMGADDVFPVFLWVVLRSHIPKLFSNCSYIQAFHSPRKLMGKQGYVMCCLRSSLEFINMVDSEQVTGMEPGEFDRCITEAERALNGGI